MTSRSLPPTQTWRQERVLRQKSSSIQLQEGVVDRSELRSELAPFPCFRELRCLTHQHSNTCGPSLSALIKSCHVNNHTTPPSQTHSGIDILSPGRTEELIKPLSTCIICFANLLRDQLQPAENLNDKTFELPCSGRVLNWKITCYKNGCF